MKIKPQKRILNEVKLPQQDRQKLIKEFIAFCIKELQFKKPIGCKVKFTNDINETETFGHYNPSTGQIVVHLGERALADSFRTLAHELVHHKQNQHGKLISQESGADGSPQENQANSMAGVIMRKWGRLHPESYEK
jgi:Zn-dependent peptidase ImmA (M78 family)